MEIYLTPMECLEDVMVLYQDARRFMCAHGNPNQWAMGYPDKDLIAQEIIRKQSYICVDEQEIAAVFSFIGGEDPTYRNIYDGAWLNDAPYSTVHRICVARQGKGVGAFCLQWCLARCGNLRIDTHRDNWPMQSLLKKSGFIYCGRIFLEDGTERVACQKNMLASQKPARQ